MKSTDTTARIKSYLKTLKLNRIAGALDEELGDCLGDPVITAATVDRMIHHSVIITIQGPSWRLNESQKLNTGE